MSKLTLGQKAHRVLLLLLGLRHPAVARVLRRRGFTDAELVLGYQLLSRLSSGRLNVADAEAITAPLGALDAWENANYPIIEAVLRRHFPEARDAVFRNLLQTEGPELVVAVGTLLERVAEQPQAVRDMLANRGVTPEVLGQARSLLSTIASLAADDPGMVDVEADAAAEKALWDWYLEWSTIVRTEIPNRRILRVLGFLKRPSGEVVEAPLPATEEEDQDPPTPASGAEPFTPESPDPNSPFTP